MKYRRIKFLNLILFLGFVSVGIFLFSKITFAREVYSQTIYSNPDLMNSFSNDWMPYSNGRGKLGFNASFEGGYLKSVKLKYGRVPMYSGGCFSFSSYKLYAYNNTDNLLASSTNMLDSSIGDCYQYNDFTFYFNDNEVRVTDIAYFRIDGGTYRQYINFYGLSGYPCLVDNCEVVPYMVLEDYNQTSYIPNWQDYSSFDPEGVYFSLLQPREFRTESNNSFYWVTATTSLPTYWGVNTQLATSSLSDIGVTIFDKSGNGTTTQLLSLITSPNRFASPYFKYTFILNFDTTDFAFASTSQYTVLIQDFYNDRYYFVKTLNFVADDNCQYCGTNQYLGTEPPAYLGDYSFGAGDFSILNLLYTKVPLVYVKEMYDIIAGAINSPTSSLNSEIILASSTYGVIKVDPLEPGVFDDLIALIRFFGVIFVYAGFGLYVIDWGMNVYKKLTE